MTLEQHHPAIAWRISGHQNPYQRCLPDVESGVAPPPQDGGDIFIAQHDFLDRQRRVPPHDLHGLGNPLPLNGGA